MTTSTMIQGRTGERRQCRPGDAREHCGARGTGLRVGVLEASPRPGRHARQADTDFHRPGKPLAAEELELCSRS